MDAHTMENACYCGSEKIKYECGECGISMCDSCKIECKYCLEIYCKECCKTCEEYDCNTNMCKGCCNICICHGNVVCEDHIYICTGCEEQYCDGYAQKCTYGCLKCQEPRCYYCHMKEDYCNNCKKLKQDN